MRGMKPHGTAAKFNLRLAGLFALLALVLPHADAVKNRRNQDGQIVRSALNKNVLQQEEQKEKGGKSKQSPHTNLSEGPIEGDTPSAPPVAALEKVKEHEHLEEQNQKKEADLKRLKQGDAKETNTKKELESTQKKQKAYPAQPADPSTPVHPSGPYMTPNGMPGGGGGPSPDPYGGGYPPAQGDPYGAPQQPMDPYGGQQPYGAQQPIADPYQDAQPNVGPTATGSGNVVLNNDEPQPPKFKEGDPEKEEEEKKKKKAKAEENAVTQPGSVMTEASPFFDTFSRSTRASDIHTCQEANIAFGNVCWSQCEKKPACNQREEKVKLQTKRYAEKDWLTVLKTVDMAALQQLREQYGPKITDGKEKCENKFYQFGERFKILCIVDFSEDQETVHEMGNVKMEQLRIKNPARYEKEQKKQQKIQEEQEEKREREEQAAMRARMRAGSNRSAVPSFTVFLAAAVLALTFVPLK